MSSVTFKGASVSDLAALLQLLAKQFIPESEIIIKDGCTIECQLRQARPEELDIVAANTFILTRYVPQKLAEHPNMRLQPNDRGELKAIYYC